MTYVIAQPCVDVKDKACIDECPVDCIYEGKRMLYIHPDECVDCGACEPVCPVEAIFYEDDTPEEWKDYYKANVRVLRRPRLARRRRQDGRDREGPPDDRRPPAAEPGPLTPVPRRPLPRPASEAPSWFRRSEARSLEPSSRTRSAVSAKSPRSPTSPGTGSTRTPRQRAAHPGGIVDLSVGTPVDPTPEVVQQALADAADAPGYPRSRHRPRCETRQAVVDWLARSFGVDRRRTRTGCCPTVGSKELVASLPAPARPRPRRPGRPARSSPTRRTRSAPRWWAPRSWPPTASPRSGRGPRACSG